MELVFSGNSIKPFSKFLSSLIKIGDYVNFEGKKDKFLLSTINSSRSAFAIFTVYPNFFDKYNIDENIIDTLNCRLLLKPLVNIFKLKNSNENIIEKCEIKFRTDSESSDTLIIKLCCKYGITMTHSLNYEECDIMHAIYQKNTLNRWVATPKLIREWLNYFYHRLEEISMICSDGVIKFKSYIDDTTTKEDLTDRPLQTEIIIDPSDFDVFSVICDVELTFNFRELKAILYFCESLEYPVKALFERDGQPIIFTVNSSNLFEADFVLATLTQENNNEYSSQSLTQSQSQINSDISSQQQSFQKNTNTIKVKKENEYNSSNDIDLLNKYGIDNNVMNSLLNPNIEDMNMDLDIDFDLNQDDNLNVNDNSKEQKTSSDTSYAPASTSTSNNNPSTSNKHNISEFKVPEPVKRIKQEPTPVKIKLEDNDEIVVPTSIISENNRSRKETKSEDINHENNTNSDNDSDEICPPSPEQTVATSLFSSQFEKEIVNSKKSKSNSEDLGEIISSTPFKKPDRKSVV